jgi:hypothetical protein
MASTTPATSRARNEFYSVGTDNTPNLKEKITNVHGADSRQARFVSDLENLLGNDKECRQASRKFRTFVTHRMKTPQNSDGLIDDFVNSGYITALERVRAPKSAADLDFYENYAANHGMTLPEAVLFGPKGTAREAFARWRLTESLRGQHRSDYRPQNEQMAEAFDKAISNTYRLPETKNKNGNLEQIDIADDRGGLPAGIEGEIAKAFGRERQLYQSGWYKGTKRLSGDLPYRIVEAMAIELLGKRNMHESGRCRTFGSRLERIIEEANETGRDAFLSLYDLSGRNRGTLKHAWNKARRILNDYAETLWRQRDTYGKQIAQRVKRQLPGTVYLNNGRYYWLPKKDEKVVPLIPEKDKDKLPGSLYKNEPGGYFWWIPDHRFRRRMIPEGKKTATKDLKTAQRLQRREWERIQQYEPQLAVELKSMRKWGVATKHKPTAVRIAKKLWSEMQEQDPKTTARVMSDKSPERTRPDMDAVWPSWTEQKARLALIENKPHMPIIYPKQDIRDEWKYGLRVPKGLETMVDKIKKVDWLTRNATLVFDDNSPTVSREIVTQSNGKKWANQQEKRGKRYVAQGSTSLDKDTGRIRFAMYRPGHGSKRTLGEEVYHVVYKIIREASPGTFGAIQTWHKKNIDNGGDPTLDTSEAFSKAMAEEELGHSSGLPHRVVKHARKIFSDKSDVPHSTIEKVKASWSTP